MGPVARAEVARQTGLSPATVTAITADLIGEELIFEKQTGDSSGGRPPDSAGHQPRRALRGRHQADGGPGRGRPDRPGGHHHHPPDGGPAAAEHEPEAVLAALAGMVDALLAQANVPRTRLLGVGLGMAGIVNSERGLLRQIALHGLERPAGARPAAGQSERAGVHR